MGRSYCLRYHHPEVGELAEISGDANWSRQGKYVYFDKHTEMIELSIECGSVTEGRAVGEPEGIPRELGDPEQLPWIGLAPDDSPLLLRSLGSQEIYALGVGTP